MREEVKKRVIKRVKAFLNARKYFLPKYKSLALRSINIMFSKKKNLFNNPQRKV